MKKIITLVLAAVLVAGASAQDRHHVIVHNHEQVKPTHPFFFIRPKKVIEKKDVVIVTYDKKDWERLKDVKRIQFTRRMRKGAFLPPASLSN